jgi:hypothetical protein
MLKKSTEAPTLLAARISKLQAERKLLDMNIAQREGELVDAAAVLAVVQRGLAAMVTEINSISELDEDQKSKIIGRLRASGEAVAGFIDGGGATAEVQGERVEREVSVPEP